MVNGVKSSRQVKPCQSCNFTLVHTDNDVIVVIFFFGGGALERVARPPRNILQNPPYFTNLQIPTNSGGMPPDPPNLSFSFAECQILIHKSILQGVQFTYFKNTPAIQNSNPHPLQTFLGSGLELSEITSAEYFIMLY